jgi:hypothetical protein
MLHIATARDGVLSATLDSIGQGTNHMPVTAVEFKDSKLTFSIDAAPTLVRRQGRQGHDGDRVIYLLRCGVTQQVAERAVILRRGSRIKLPDAIIKATAESEGRVLNTRNACDFPASTPGMHIPNTI